MNRRRFFRTIAMAGILDAAERNLADSEQASSAGWGRGKGFLDTLRDDIHRWSESLWDERAGGFRQNAQVGANLLSTADVAWLRYATNDPDLDGGHRTPWVRYLQQSQDPKTGVIRYGTGGQGHSNGHAMWTTVRALHILGGELLFFPEYLRPVLRPEGLRAWFDAVDWDGRRSNHHEVLGLAPLLASLNDPAWTETFYAKIAEQQNPQTGGFPKRRTNISRTFAYTAIYRATGRMPPHAERIIDTILSLQHDSGFWDKFPRFHTMDATYILARLPAAIGHRQQDCRQALERLAVALPDLFAANRRRYENNPHSMLAVVHTFGLLQEVFPDRFPSHRPYRFDWDKPEMYRCQVIVAGVRQQPTAHNIE